jgi:hypothetical protein
MKNLFLLFLMLQAFAGYSQTSLPVTFESGNYAFVDFDGGNTTVVSNPDATGLNTSANVAQHVRDGGQVWAGTYMHLDAALDFSVNNTFTMHVYSPEAGIPVLFKLESEDAGQYVELSQSTTVANAWEQLTFNFGAQTSDLYTKIILIFNLGVLGNGGTNSTYYFDDIEFIVGALDQIDLPITFEDQNTDYTVTDFGGNSTVLGEDPSSSMNTVAITTKNTGAETWAGTTMGTNAGLANPIPFTETDTRIHVNIYAPASGITVMLKAEDKTNGTLFAEANAVTTTSNAWETLEFDFAGMIDLQNTYDKLSIFFDFGNSGDGAIYYWDDVTFVVTNPPQDFTLPIDFEAGPYIFHDFDGGSTEVVANPDISGINTSDQVAKHIRYSGQVWAGTWMQLIDPIDFTSNNTFLMKVYSPEAGIPVLFKIEAENSSLFVEMTQYTTVANEWEELSYNFGTQTSDLYTKIVIIFNLGVMGDGGPNSTYYLDDIVFMNGTPLNQIDLPITFDDENVNYTMIDFGGNSSVLGEDPINSSNTVAISTKNVGAETWAGTTMSTDNGLANPIPFTDTDTKIHIDIYAPASGITVLLKAEDKTNGAIFSEATAVTTASNAWETLEFDFAGLIDLQNTYDKLSIFFDFGNSGTGSVYYWDNVALIHESNSISDISNNIFFLYPNPAKDKVFITTEQSLNTVDIYSIQGQKVLTLRNVKNSIDISSLPNGIYTVIIKDITGLSHTEKLVKM